MRTAAGLRSGCAFRGGVGREWQRARYQGVERCEVRACSGAPHSQRSRRTQAGSAEAGRLGRIGAGRISAAAAQAASARPSAAERCRSDQLPSSRDKPRAQAVIRATVIFD